MDYDLFRTLAVDLITLFGNGQTVTFYRLDESYDPLSGEGTGAPVPHTVLGVQLPTGINDISTPPDDRAANRSLKVYVPARGLAIVPRDGDELSLPGHQDRFVVTSAKATQPDGQQIYYEVLAERRADTT